MKKNVGTGSCLDISDNNVARACERIADWLESTGGLWSR
jgi:hypothetical protein